MILPSLREPHSVGVLLTDPRRIDGAARKEMLGWLSDDERTRWTAFRAPDAALQFLVGRGLLRAALSHYAGGPPDRWRFRPNAFGKPGLDHPPIDRDLRFNLSHTSDLVALAIAEGFDVGVDVERLDRGLDTEGLAPLVLAPEEVEAAGRLAPAERAVRFLQTWTLKEAYSKARGLGVSLPFTSIAFDLDDAPRLRAAPNDTPSLWTFSLEKTLSGHALAVAARSGLATFETVWTN